MLYLVLMSHDVRDFATWKAAFDEFPPRQGGAVLHIVCRKLHDRNHVTVLAGFETADAARAYVTLPALKEAMARGGVIGHPRVELLEQVEAIEY